MLAKQSLNCASIFATFHANGFPAATVNSVIGSVLAPKPKALLEGPEENSCQLPYLGPVSHIFSRRARKCPQKCIGKQVSRARLHQFGTKRSASAEVSFERLYTTGKH